MGVLFLIGRILFGLFFFINGLNHFNKFSATTAYAASKGVPLAGVGVVIVGLLLILRVLSILPGYRPDIGIVLLVVFLVPVSFIMHNFWANVDPRMKQADMTHFMKNLALVGTSLTFRLIPRPWPTSFEGGKPLATDVSPRS